MTRLWRWDAIYSPDVRLLQLCAFSDKEKEKKKKPLSVPPDGHHGNPFCLESEWYICCYKGRKLFPWESVMQAFISGPNMSLFNPHMQLAGLSQTHINSSNLSPHAAPCFVAHTKPPTPLQFKHLRQLWVCFQQNWADAWSNALSSVPLKGSNNEEVRSQSVCRTMNSFFRLI